MNHVCVVRPHKTEPGKWIAACSCGYVSEPLSMSSAGNAKTNHSKKSA